MTGHLPPPQILNPPDTEGKTAPETSEDAVRAALTQHGALSTSVRAIVGPQAIRYMLTPDRVLPSKFERAVDAVALATGRPTRYSGVHGREVGFEVGRDDRDMVLLNSLLHPGDRETLKFAAGRGITGAPVRGDLTKLPHMLVAGATGSGKSVFVNAVLALFLLHNPPETLRLTMIDPKRVELAMYEGLPHLSEPVVTDVSRAVDVLGEVVAEMDRRYSLFERAGVKNLGDYNRDHPDHQLPRHVIVIDELADLMMMAAKQVEEHIVRIAQLARAAGMHLILATQRPAATVVTPKIKANIPGRAVFQVNTHTDSKVALDFTGAENLTGMGDGLWKSPDGIGTPERFQSAYVSDEEIVRIVAWWEKNWTPPEVEAPEVVAPLRSDEEVAAEREAWAQKRAALDDYVALGEQVLPITARKFRTPPEVILRDAGLSRDVVEALIEMVSDRITETITNTLKGA